MTIVICVGKKKYTNTMISLEVWSRKSKKVNLSWWQCEQTWSNFSVYSTVTVLIFNLNTWFHYACIISVFGFPWSIKKKFFRWNSLDWYINPLNFMTCFSFNIWHPFPQPRTREESRTIVWKNFDFAFAAFGCRVLVIFKFPVWVEELMNKVFKQSELVSCQSQFFNL